MAMTDGELWDAAWIELTKTTDSYPAWKRKGFPASSHWAKAKTLGEQIGLTPPEPIPVPPPAFTVASSIPDGATLSTPTVWEATPSAPVTQVDFYIDSVLRSTEMVTPYRYNGDTGVLDPALLSVGPHPLRIIATGPSGTAVTDVGITVSAPAPIPPLPTTRWWGFSLSPPDGVWSAFSPATSLAQLQKAVSLGMNCPRLTGHDYAAQQCRDLGIKEWIAILGAGKSFPDTAGVIAYCQRWPEAIIAPGNELNIGGSPWTAQNLAKAQLDLNKAMKAAGIKNRLLLSSVGNDSSTQGNLLPLDWCKALAAAGCVYPAAFDIGDYHMYGETAQGYDNWMHVWTPDQNGHSIQMAFGYPPYVLSEFGCKLDWIAGDLNRQKNAVINWMTKIKTLDKCLGGMWYTILDHTDAGYGWGLEDGAGNHRPAWDAYKAAAT